MPVILFIDLVVVLSLIRAARQRLENTLPVFCFILVLAPLESRLVIPGAFDLSTERVAMLTLLGLFLARGRERNKRSIPLKYIMLLHVTWALCSTIYSLSVATSVKQLIAQVVEYYLLYYMFLRIVSDVRTIYRILHAMTLAMGLCCLVGVVEAYALWSVLSIFPSELWTTYGRNDPLCLEWGRGLRIRSTFQHPILFGDALAMMFPIALYLLSIWRQRRQRVVLWAIIGLMFWALYKTGSRGPWVAGAASCGLLFLLVPNRVRKYVLATATLSLIAVLARPGIWNSILNLYQSTQDSTTIAGASYEYRSALMEAVKDAVAQSPGRALFGYGFGTFRELGLDIHFLDTVRHWYTCDNHWALFLYETGYVGLVIMIILLFKPLLMTLNSYRRLPRPERYVSGVLFISLAAFYFLLLSVAGYNWGQQGFMAWILIALSVAYPGVVQRNGSPRTESKTTSKLVVDGH
jgi:hypothetical protein